MPDPRREAIEQAMDQVYGGNHVDYCLCTHCSPAFRRKMVEAVVQLLPPVPDRAALDQLFTKHHVRASCTNPAHYLDCVICLKIDLLAWAGPGPRPCQTCGQSLPPGHDQP